MIVKYPPTGKNKRRVLNPRIMNLRAKQKASESVAEENP